MHGTPIYRIICLILLAGVLAAGWYFKKNEHRYFKTERGANRETAGSLGYYKMLVYALWGHLILFLSLAALKFH